MLTVWDFLVRVQVFIHIHGEIHHVCVAEEVQLSLKKLLFIVDLLQSKTHIYSITIFKHAPEKQNSCTETRK